MKRSTGRIPVLVQSIALAVGASPAAGQLPAPFSVPSPYAKNSVASDM